MDIHHIAPSVTLSAIVAGQDKRGSRIATFRVQLTGNRHTIGECLRATLAAMSAITLTPCRSRPSQYQNWLVTHKTGAKSRWFSGRF
jgi:hypothetical protein